MQVIDDNHCFICGSNNPIGLHAVFTADPEKGRAETRVSIPEHFQGWQGIVHGGILSALLDEICAQACMARGLQVVTSEMRLRYRKPVPTGSVVTVIGEIVGDRRRLIDVRGVIEMDGQTMAEAEVIMFKTAG
ncbi:PaaI family thioesterase [Geobacter hydrogenophilus]|uniref:Acyl-coenzyme A thioesterase THEM4 n=1 Tax=Geobacter hydrogenophilus TaxID=40983 RepID=A0A9W6G218_9BACT|nr:PaaI family thioesterase [Geobacter hydrogenophilus]MBT0893212.1 PaaI family thioesterase [Geobacter hydrogenophilus]GLI38943.1 acyl-CoA thioesterase [Geobacter hydrogenophilus]